LAFYFQQQANETNKWIDGNEDGIIDIKDITPLASNFGTECAGYLIERSENGDDFYEIEDYSKVSFNESSGVGRKKFKSPDLENLVSGIYLRVVPYDSVNVKGVASEPVEVPENELPTAVLKADPTQGKRPLTVTFNALDSHDNGTIKKYEWDFDGDGNYDVETTIPTISYEYNESIGIYNATLRVTDDDGGTATDSVSIEVLNNPPVAKFTAEPTSGPAPLAVTFDATKSSDPDGNIIKYEWDFDGDGVYDQTKTIPTISHLYENNEMGINNATLRVTDNNNATDTDSLEIKVSGTIAHTFGGGSEDVVKAITVDADGNTWLVGYTDGYGSNVDVLLLKYNPDGNLVFAKTWGGSEDDVANAITSDSSGIYVTGWTASFGAEIINTFLLKLDLQGNPLWQKTWSENGNWLNIGKSLAIDSFGNVYVTGSTRDTPNDSFLLKYDSNGNLLRQKGLGVGRSNSFITIDNSDNVYLTGTFSNGSLVYLIHTDSQENINWAKTWGGTGTNLANDITTDSSGNIYLAGYFKHGNLQDALLLKYDSNGNFIFAKSWNGPKGGADKANAIALDPLEGYIYVAGSTDAYDTGNLDDLLLKYDYNGNFHWARTWDTEGAEEAYDLLIDNRGILYMAGSAPNAYGNWQEIPGWDEIPFDEPGSFNAELYDIEDSQETTANGILSDYTGVEDEGGGSSDSLFIKYFPE